MKNKKLITWIVLLVLVLTIGLVPVLATDDDDDDAQQDQVVLQDESQDADQSDDQDKKDDKKDDQEVGPIIPEEVIITYDKPITGDAVEKVNKTFESETTILIFNDITWNKDEEKLKDDDVFAGGDEYDLCLDLSITGGYLTEDTKVLINDEEAEYDTELTKAANQENAGADGYMARAVFRLTVKADNLPAPGASFTATGDDCGVLTNVDKELKFSTDGGASWIDCGGTSVELTGMSEGEIQVAHREDDANVQHINVSRQKAPDALKVVNCTTKENNDGIIKGVDSSMEYRADGEEEYTDCTGKEITDLIPGKYFVRRKPSGSKFSSGDATVTVAKYSPALPKITKQPENATIFSGEDCEYSIKAKNTDKYEWHVIDVVSKKDYILDPDEDKAYYTGFGTDTIKVLSVNKLNGECDCEYNGDRYYCVISNKEGKVTSKTVEYNVTHCAESGWQKDASGHWQTCHCGAMVNKAEHIDENKDGRCDVCDFDTSNSKTFHILEGAQTTWKSGSADDVVIKADGELDDFKELKIDDKTVDAANYDLEKGSTIVTLHSDYLNALEDGAHIVTFVYADGSVSTQLSIAAKQSKSDEDEVHRIGLTSNIVIVCLLAIIVALVLVAVLLIRKLRRPEEQGQHFRQ